MTSLFLFLLFLVSYASSTLSQKVSSDLQAWGVQNNSGLVDGHTFDYIIVGGGLSGLTIAGRLSEDPSISILVIEAGNDDRNNPEIYDIYNFGNANGSLIWEWMTDLNKTIDGGRTLGGSSSINGATWTRGARAQYDAMSELLEPDEAYLEWNFDSIFHYMKKSEGFSPPNAEERAKGASSIDEYHGFDGPVQVTFPELMFGGPQQPAFVDSVINLTSIKHCEDLNGGNTDCVAYTPNTLNRHEDDRRSSSAEAYLSPVESERRNWLTLVGHQVTKIELEGEVPDVVATGVQFMDANLNGTGSVFRAFAKKEVIVSAGAIGTPHILQLSGIGDPTVLEPVGIKTIVNLTTVGRNLQEQSQNIIAHTSKSSFNPGGRGPPDCIAYPSLRELFSDKGGGNGSVTVEEIEKHILDSYPSWAKEQAINGLNADSLEEIFKIQARLVINESVPVVELFSDLGYTDSFLALVPWQLLPFSRGNVSITSPSPFKLPQVIVNWFAADIDLSIQTASLRLSRNVLNAPAFLPISDGEYFPGTNTTSGGGGVPDDDGYGGSDAVWREWLLENFLAVSHPIGTAAMMRRGLGGVVDGRLKVYDTRNVRVVDASILPMQLSAHLSSPLYGVAEKAADIIKSGV